MLEAAYYSQLMKKNFDFELNEGQFRAINDWDDGKNLFLAGTAGTGKTFIALFLAIKSIINKSQGDLIVVRSLVPTRNIGFLPGTEDDKSQPYMEFYESTIMEILSAFVSKNSNRDFLKSRVKFQNTSFLRGKTWDNSIIFIDELQNLNVHEVHTVMTRVGKNSRVIASGDFFQSDLSRRESSYNFMEEMVSLLNSFSQVNFYIEDIVRSDFVKEWCEIAEPFFISKN
jgi:phosphate starvation-inducible PhoH-like protein